MPSGLAPFVPFVVVAAASLMAWTLLHAAKRRSSPARTALRLGVFCTQCGWEGHAGRQRACARCGSQRVLVTST
jgi:hypothetical protein